MFVFKKYDRQNHVWSFMAKYLRFLCKFTSWSGETPTGNFILDKNNERPDWMTDLNTLTPHGKKMHVKEIYVYIYSFVWFWNIVDHWFKQEKMEKGGILFLNFC
jgi:hypothetical protein